MKVKVEEGRKEERGTGCEGGRERRAYRMKEEAPNRREEGTRGERNQRKGRNQGKNH